MDTELVRTYADKLGWLAARLTRRTADMVAMEPGSQEFRNALLVSDVLVRDLATAVKKLLASTAQQ